MNAGSFFSALVTSPTLYAFLMVAVYAAAIGAARWHLIAQPSRRLLLAQVQEVEVLVNACPTEHGWSGKAGALELLEKAKEPTNGNGFVEALFWSRGQEIAGWSRVHAAERMLVASLPPPIVRAKLEAAAEGLRSSDRPGSLALVKKIDGALSPQADSRPECEYLRALLEEARKVLYNDEDTRFAELVTWHNKASWLIFASLLSILGAVATVGGAQALLAGAVGGLLSRLSRVHRAPEVPTDYGASWTTLFLSPPIGALAAQGGFLAHGHLEEMVSHRGGVQLLVHG